MEEFPSFLRLKNMPDHFFLIEVSLIYNIVLVSDIQQSDFVIHIYIYSVFQFSIIVYT